MVEAAPAAVFETIASAAIEAGRIFVPASVGALLPRMHLVRRAQETGARIVVPTGALLGLDAVRAAAEGRVDSVTIESRKPPRGLEGAPYLVQHGIDVSGLTAPKRVFEGNAFDAAAGFPANVNVAAALALAGIGPVLHPRRDLGRSRHRPQHAHDPRGGRGGTLHHDDRERAERGEPAHRADHRAVDAGLPARAGGDAEGRHVADRAMLAELLYFVSIALFGFVILGAAQLPNDMWLVAGIFPVFLAMILGFMMWVYAWSEFGLPVSVGSLVVPIVALRCWCAGVSTRNLFIAICATTVLGLICARLAFLAADLG